ncbi:hypothetical protein [Limosilactobacillus reuteri]|uniref:hypothetical protein n=1 Tax=Limosilactobacillus reuteri TaxID=1598 RepID=UPI001C5AE6F2|nr:hypothetical protein [Limosilactobacillus reuteri]MBW3350713.1 hypothetical protein [Limosilactobacillus reuteri]UUW69609.1 hypothetical protein NUJ10_11260 [Limosilactobacillus reuteri]
MIKVTDLLTKQEVIVDDSKKKMTDFSNKNGLIYYSAPEANTEVEHWVDYKVNGRVDDVEEKLSTYNNAVRLAYAKVVNFAANENDPDHEIWNGIVEYVKHNQEKFFDENGDWKDNTTVGINVKDFLN